MKKITNLSVFTVLLFLATGDQVWAQNPTPPVYPLNLVNYTRTWEATAPESSPANLVTRPVTDVKQLTQYYDGLGRPVQTVLKQGSPLGNDMVTAYVYDASNRQTFTYLPFASNTAQGGDITNDGTFKADAFQQQQAFYNTQFGGIPSSPNLSTGDAHWPYSQTNYEASPLGRVSNTYAPGSNWVGGQNSSGMQHNVKNSYQVNAAADNVQVWNIAGVQNSIPTSSGAYAAGQLYKTVVTDEQGHQQIQYTDLYGQVILKKVQNTAVADNGSSAHAGWLCTYYVYDDNGNLRFIIPPSVVQLIDGHWSISQVMADEYCYRFEYDAQNRMIVRKSPGTPSGTAGEVWMIYDARNRLVLSQDPDQRPSSQWLCYLYDGLDRPVLNGMVTLSGTESPLQLQVTAQTGGNSSGTVAGTAPPSIQAWLTLSTPLMSGTWQASQEVDMDDGFSSGSNYVAEITPQSTAPVTATIVISNNPLPSGTTVNALKASFYDNYNWLSTAGTSLFPTLNQANTANSNYFITGYNASPVYAQPVAQSGQLQGAMTGQMAQELDQNQNIYSLSIVDDHGRVIQTQSTNMLQGTDISTTQYDWMGKVQRTLVAHSIGGANPQTYLVSTAASYDAAGRPLGLTKTVSGTVNGTAIPAVTKTISADQYSELGQLQQKTLGNSLETLGYDYNIRGWLLGVNRPYAKTTSVTGNYFGFDLGYDQPVVADVRGGTVGAYTAPLFNGNIAGMVWRSKGDGEIRKYDYAYDPVNRLTAADFNQYDGGFGKTAGIDFSVSNMSYDGNGNLLSMSQNGWLLGGSQQIDRLTYNYNNSNASNRLMNVQDNSAYNSSNPQSTLGDFHYTGTKAAGASDYTYDNNGNVTSDVNRSVTSIVYNYLNLPKTITIANNRGTITYIYDATGSKLQKTTIESNASITLNGTAYPTGVTTTTTYIHGFVYKSLSYTNPALSSLQYTNRLQFLAQEEGRVRALYTGTSMPAVPSTLVFDYFIRDHLNNVRMVLTDEQQQDTYPAATVEADAIGTEQSYYNIVNDAAHIIPVSSLPWWNSATGSAYLDNNGIANPGNPNPNNSNAQVYKLNGQTGDKYGMGIAIKVMAGDQVSIFARSAWHNTGTSPGSFPISSAISSFLSAFAGTSVITSSGEGLVTGATLNSSTATTNALSGLLTNTQNQGNPTIAPKAAINWILFNDQFVPVSIGTDLVSSTGDVVKPHSEMNLPMTANGYLYVYCSNESDIDVFFDNLQVINQRGPILEETHYYPVGLTMAGISDRAWNKLPNFYHYQSNEMQNQEFSNGTGLEEYDFSARYYDPQLGRWHNQDPAGQYASPYAAMGNTWPNGTDPNGQFFGIDDVIAAGLGGILNLTGQLLSGNVHNFGQGLEYFGVGALEGEATLYGGPALAGLVSGGGNALVQSSNSPGGVDWNGVIESSIVGTVEGAATGALSSAASATAPSVGAITWDKVESWAIKGATSSVINAATTDIGNNHFGLSQIWKSAVSGAVLGAAEGYLGTATDKGGAGLKETHAGSFLYADFVSVGKSVASNWSNGNPLLSKINLAVGPVTLTLGKGQTLLQVLPNISTLANLGNYIYGAVNQGLFGGKPAVWGFTSSGGVWSTGGFLGDFQYNSKGQPTFSSGVLGWLNKFTIGGFKPGNAAGGFVEPGLGNTTSFGRQDAW